MIKQFFFSIAAGMTLFGFNTVSAMPADRSPLNIVENSASPYRIVIGQNSPEAEQYAARELADFFKESTGVDLKIITDADPPNGPEIVLGQTNRLDATTLPVDLRPTTSDGYTCFVSSDSIHILGRYPRGTLYGVYDWLEKNLGIRFLAPEVNHVPIKSVVPVSRESFRYDPPMEYRNICTFQDQTWGIRNRLNARWGSILKEKMLGGIRWVGPAIHTASKYISPDEYFEAHPEYFALVNGKRSPKTPSGTQPAQLCFSNPDVYDILQKKMKLHLEKYRVSANYNPSSKVVIELSINDGGGNCECSQCAGVNSEEGTKGATLFRILNRLSDGFAKDYPKVNFETLAYGWAIKPPEKTVLRDNIIVCFAPLKADQGRLITDSSSERNRHVLEDLKAWQGKCKQIYLWNYYYNSWSPLDPFPDIQVLVENLRLYRQHQVNGLFAESSYTPASELRELRHYLLAQAIWKRDIDEKAVTREFCQLYYGDGAEGILEYLQFARDYFLSLAPIPLLCQSKLPFSDAFLKEANIILERAEQAASTEETKRRVAIVRLPIWYQILLGQFSENAKINDLSSEWSFRPDPDNQGLTEQWQTIKDFTGWEKIATGSWVDQGYPRGVAWYGTTLEVPEGIPGEASLALYFGAVDGMCDIYLDGEKIAERKVGTAALWNSGFYIKLPQPVKPGLYPLVIRVDKNRAAAGITKPVSLVDLSGSVSDEVRVIGERFIDVAKKGGYRHKKNWLKKDLFPKIRTLIKKKASTEKLDPRILRRTAALLPNIHRTWKIEDDPESLSGACAVQKSDRRWTAAQGVTWRIDKELLATGAALGSQHKLRARVKLNAAEPQGAAFSFGYIHRPSANRSHSIDKRPIQSRDLKPNKWEWVDYPGIIELQPSVKIFITAVKNPTINSIAVDALDLMPVAPEHRRYNPQNHRSNGTINQENTKKQK